MRSIARALLLVAIFVTGALALSASALGAVDIGAGEEQPVIAYEPGTATTYIAWRGPTTRSIELCVLAGGASACNGGAPYVLADGPAEAGPGHYEPLFFALQIVVEPGGGVVLLANLEGVNPAVEQHEYSADGEVAWASVAGGATFASPEHGLADHGELLAPDEGDGDPPSAGAIALGGTDEVGVFGNEFPFGDGFAAFNLTTPAPATLPKPDLSELWGSDFGADSGQIATLLNTPKANEDLVVTVGSGPFSKVPACPSSEQHTGYGVADATVANLDKQSFWEVGGPYFKPISCQAESAVLAGGPSGIGVFEDEGPGLEGAGSDSVDYRAFDPTTLIFGSPVQVSDETSLTLDGADELSVSQDSEGGIYASWHDGRGVELSYSNTKGASWQAPVTAAGEEASDPVIAGVGGGNFEVAYKLNGQEYLEPLNYSALYAAQHSSSSSSGGSTTTTTPASGPPPPPLPPPPPPPPVTITDTANVDGDVVSLSAPNKCVRNGLVSSELNVSLPSAKRKGKVVVKIYEAIFKVGNTTLIVKRKHLSDAPFKVTIHLKHVKPGSKLVLTVHALIAVHHGPKRSKTFKLTLTSCA
jgi:hypothetical protein